MKTLLTVLVGAIGWLALASSSQAQIITWGVAQNMSNPADILNNGSYVDAASFYGSSLTINSVVFNPLSGGTTFTDGANISVFANNGTYGSSSFMSGGSPPDSTAYNNLASVFGFGFEANGSITLSGLTNGNTYQVQVWSSYQYAPGGDATTFTGPVGSNSVTLLPEDNQFATGTFVADGSTETFAYNQSVGYDLVNAISVRDTSGTSVVPEPSTYALLGLGLFALIMLQKRKSQV